MGAYDKKYSRADLSQENIGDEIEALEAEVQDIIKLSQEIGNLSTSLNKLSLKLTGRSSIKDLYKRIEDIIDCLVSDDYIKHELKSGGISLSVKEVNYLDWFVPKLKYQN